MQRSIIKVFLASPGDLVDERKAAKRIVDEENRNHAVPQGFQFELVGWEDTVAQHGRAQEIINRDLDQCNYFVGLLWKRWGSPPGPAGGQYTSGFQEEYERSEVRFKSTGKPKISLLFKSISSAEISDAGPQLQKVLEFKKSYTEDYRGVYHTFDDLREFEERFRSILALFLRSEMSEETKIEAEEASKTLKVNDEPVERPDESEALFESDVKSFILDLFSRPSNQKEHEFTAVEAARLRLLGATLHRSENDETVVGVHDANLLYKEFLDKHVSKREVRGLLAAGLNFFEAQNTPIWRWLWSVHSSPLLEATFRTLIGSAHQRKNAFKALSLFSDTLEKLEGSISREKFVDWWLSNDEEELIVAALNYLGRRGITDDINKIDLLLDSSKVTISKAAVSAKIGILARENVEAALEVIAVREDSEVSDTVLDLILSNPRSLRTSLLRNCLTNRSTRFRRNLAKELLDRGELSREDGEVLVLSSDAQTRVLGALAIKSRSTNYSLSDARAHIVKPTKQNALSLFSIGSRDFEGEAAYEEYKHTVLCALEQVELEALLKSESTYSHDITFALYDKCFSKYRAQIIYNLEDRFAGFLEGKISRGAPSAAPDDKVRDFMRQKLVQKTVELLAMKKAADGLTEIRKAIDQGGVEYSEDLVRLFEKKGDWEDIPRVVSLCQNFPSTGMSILSIVQRTSENRLAAKALLKIGRNRIADLLAVSMPVALWNSVLEAMTGVSFSSFSDARISEWLRDEAEAKRKSVALKCVIVLPKSRIDKLLRSYITGSGTYYYNVVSWLDLGVSVERARAVEIARQALSEM